MQESIAIEHDLLATKMQRFANCLIDGVIVLIIFGIIVLLAVLAYRFLDRGGLLLWFMEISPFKAFAFTAVLNTLYYIFFEFVVGSTVGKFVTNSRVVTLMGQKPSFSSIVVRSLVRLIPFEPLTFLGTYSNGWHDSISKTAVVDINKFEMGLRLKKHIANTGNAEI